jgi:hypothetical protein
MRTPGGFWQVNRAFEGNERPLSDVEFIQNITRIFLVEDA